MPLSRYMVWRQCGHQREAEVSLLAPHFEGQEAGVSMGTDSSPTALVLIPAMPLTHRAILD